MASWRSIWVALTVLALAVVACETSVAPTPTPSPTAGGTGAPTGERLAAVQQRGQLICGVNGGLQGFSFLDEASSAWSGFDTDYCRAIAAAVLGDPEAVEFRALSTEERGTALQTGEIDVLIRNTTWTVTRDTTWGLFAPTTFYDGQGIMVDTARTQATTLEELSGATICVQSGTTTELNLADQMGALGLTYEPLVFADIDPTYEAYSQGRCDAVTSDRSQLVGRRTGFDEPDQHALLEVVMSKEPLGPVAPLGDEPWFNVVKWTVFATIEAEELGITSANVAEMRDTSENPVIQRLLGQINPELGEALGLDPDWVVGVIEAVGNYGEIFDRNLGPDTDLGLDRGLNNLWTDGGILYSPPYR